MRGRKPIPSNVHRLSGTRPQTEAAKGSGEEPSPDWVAPERPEHLTGEAAVEWDRIVSEIAQLGLATRPDRAALAAYCQTWASAVEARAHLDVEGTVIQAVLEEKVDSTGLVVDVRFGKPTVNPWFGVEQRALDAMRRFLVEFGLTPSSRARIRVQRPKGGGKISAFRSRRPGGSGAA